MQEKETPRRSSALVIILVILFLAAVYIIWEVNEIWRFAGNYQVVTEADSTYELILSQTGRITIVDVGAGNPALEGFLYRTPLSAKDGKYVIRAGGETDPVFLDLGENGMKANAWLSIIGLESPEGFEPCNVINLETETDRMQFNEIKQ